MNLLAIDTSTDACSVALTTNNKRFSDHRIVPKEHAQLLLPMIAGLCKEAGMVASNLDAVVFGQGPGSFTGLRIAASAAAGIAFGAECGIIALSSLRAMAQGVHREHGDTSVLVSFDARMGEMYWGIYQVDSTGLMQPLKDDALSQPDDVIIEDGYTLAGSGCEAYKSQYPLRLDAWPNAADLLTLALPEAMAGRWQSADKALPIYLRDRVALTEAQRAAGETLN